MTEQEKLLNKYYNGETSLEEENKLKALFQIDDKRTSEQDIFGYFESENSVPNDLEENIYRNLDSYTQKKSTIRRQLFRLSSAAAVVLILLSIYTNVRNTKNAKMENDFFLMEQALFQVSESIKPASQQEEMLVLWVDEDVEIIIN